MTREIVLGLVGLVAGLSIGFFAANSLNREAATTTALANSNTSGAVSSAITTPAVDEMLQRANSEPQNFAAQMQTGDMYARIDRLEKAIEFYKRGLILQPENFEANVVLANTLFDSQKFEEAETYYTKALTIKNNDVNARVDLGTTFVERVNPDYDRAIKEFKTALELDPKSEPAVYYLGIAELRKGNREAANARLIELEMLNATSPLIGRLRQNIDAPKP